MQQIHDKRPSLSFTVDFGCLGLQKNRQLYVFGVLKDETRSCEEGFLRIRSSEWRRGQERKTSVALELIPKWYLELISHPLCHRHWVQEVPMSWPLSAREQGRAVGDLLRLEPTGEDWKTAAWLSAFGAKGSLDVERVRGTLVLTVLLDLSSVWAGIMMKSVEINISVCVNGKFVYSRICGTGVASIPRLRLETLAIDRNKLQQVEPGGENRMIDSSALAESGGFWKL